MRQRAIQARAPNLAQCTGYSSLRRRFMVLMEKTSIVNSVPGRDRVRFSLHSTRVAAVCYLLKAGLAAEVIATLANWSSDQLVNYSKQLSLNPHMLEAFPFFNPLGLAGGYTGRATLRSPLGKRKR
jgi:hypothetical protein